LLVAGAVLLVAGGGVLLVAGGVLLVAGTAMAGAGAAMSCRGNGNGRSQGDGDLFDGFQSMPDDLVFTAIACAGN
jgi:hypothetical protein